MQNCASHTAELLLEGQVVHASALPECVLTLSGYAIQYDMSKTCLCMHAMGLCISSGNSALLALQGACISLHVEHSMKLTDWPRLYVDPKSSQSDC